MPPSLDWRPLSRTHVPQILEIAGKIHPGLPERSAVFEERIALFPSGCLGLFENRRSHPDNSNSNGNDNNDDEEEEEKDTNQTLHGYLISHPIPHRCPPALDTLLTCIPEDAKQYYIHDVAILPEARGTGMARVGVEKVLQIAAAKGYETSSLVSVYGTVGFWARFGFREVEVSEGLAAKVLGYGEGARFLERRDG